MKIFGIADLHLPFARPDKTMEPFGGNWVGYTDKLEKGWRAKVSEEDLVLLAGDISWAMKTHEAIPDLEWIHALPGTKVMIKGNHDFWWDSLGKVKKVLPSTIHAVQNTLFTFQGIEVTGTRLWETTEYSYEPFIEFHPTPAGIMVKGENKEEGASIFERELLRLEACLKLYTKEARLKICMVHYPPLGADLSPSRASALIEKAGVDHCLFGHLHQVKEGALPMGSMRGVAWHFVAGDYLNFIPKQIASLD